MLAPQDRLCDPAFEDCRADILKYIQQETVQIDMGFWMMTDARYSNELVKAWSRGVKIRLLMDPRCGPSHPACLPQIDQLKAAGIPMRNRLTSGILHWKMVLFVGQGQLEFAGANYAPFEMTPEQPYVNYTDELVYFTNVPSIVRSFMTKFDDLWVSTTEFANYANISGPLTRSFPTYPIDPELNFPPDQSYRSRALAAYAAEQQKIDVLMFRVTDEQHSNAMINAVNRGVPVRLITDETEYRNRSRLWHSYNIDKMYAAGVQVRLDGHQGINHEKAVVLQGTGMTIFGSSNWTSPSSDTQREHNMFTTKAWIYDWVENQFNRKWSNQTGFTETKPFVPLPPDAPVYNQPANGATGLGTSGVSLSFYAGLWAHKYDIYFGTSPNPPLLEANRHLGPSQHSTDYRYYALPALQPGTTYYWKIVSKTMAFKTADGPVWSFRTAGTTPPPNAPPTVTLTAPANGATFTAPATINLTATAGDSDGSIAKVDFFAGSTLIGTDTAAPYAVTWNNVPAGTYNLFAVAVDDDSAATTSSGATVTVGSAPPPSNAPPSVTLTAPANGTTFTAPATINLTATAGDSDGTIAKVDFFAGSTLIASDTAAPYAVTWNNVSAGTYSLTAVATDDDSAKTTSAAATITVGNSTPPPGTLPAGWSHADVGATGASGNATFSSNTFSVTGAGADVWGTADAFHYAYRTLDGDGTIVARVASIEYVHAWTKAGVMIRNSLSPSAAHAFMLVAASSAKGVPFQRRRSDGDISYSTSGSLTTAPRWVKLVRSGNLISGFESADGVTWTAVGSDTFTMGENVLVGLAVSSHVSGVNATATFDNVTVTVASPPPPSNVPPSAALTSPANGATYTAPATINLAASASDSDGTIAKVEFFAGSTLLATDTTAPYAFTWSNVAAGSYSLTAVATDDKGATTSSAAVSVTVSSPSNVPPSATMTSPANGATFTAPATINLAASASDSDGTIAKVDFFAGSTLIGTDTAAPYAYTWSNVPAGSYSLRAVATDDKGATASTASVTVTVTSAPPPSNVAPSVAMTSPTNGATFTAPASVNLAASASDSDGTIAKVDFFAGSTLIASDTSAPYAFTWSNVAAGTYSLTAIATDNAGAATRSAAVSITVSSAPPPGSLPTGWTNTDVGATGAAGSTTFSNGTFTVTGAGADVWGTADALQYAYTSVSGDFTITARVTSIQAIHAWTKAGVMIRNTLSASSSHGFMLVAASATKGVPFQRRKSEGDISYSTPGSQSTAPRWVRLVRMGNTITGYESADGVTWTAVGSDTFVMGANVLVGLGVSSHVSGTTATCTFDNVTIR